MHELNGVAERFNRSIMDMSRCLMSEAKVNRKYWPEIVKTAPYLKNRILANTIETKTPYELFFNERPSAKYLKIYGSKVFVRTPEQLRKTKWDDKAKVGILLGYSEMGYRVLINNKIIDARHVDIIEENIKCIGFIDENEVVEERNEKGSEKITENSDSEQSEQDVDEVQSEEMPETEQKRPTRNRLPNSRYYNDEFVAKYVYVNYCDASTPNTLEEAMGNSEAKHWKRAMEKEMESLRQNNTWKLVEKPENKKTIDVKWVFKKKKENEYKARLVVRRYQQKDHVDDIYSPIAKMQTLKLLLSFCCQNGLIIEQMDVETAFLNSKVKSEVYVNQPAGYENGTTKVYKLMQALYGLRESPRSWYECFNRSMEEMKFKRSKYDYCLYINRENMEVTFILLFVDDMLICSNKLENVKRTKLELSKRYKMKDLGKVKTYIGIYVDYDLDKREMKLSQTKYIESLAMKYNLENAKLYHTPMETNLKITPAVSIDNRIKYRNLIGEVLYVSTGTRPDVSFSVNYLARFQNCYDATHYKYALRILKYLYLTKGLKLTYRKDNKADILDCMVDADWAGDFVYRISTSGYVIRFFGNTIYWKSRKQGSVTKSSTHAEYVSLSEAVTEVNLIRNMLNEAFNIRLSKPVKVYEDNSGALSIAKYGNFSKNSRHIEVQYHFVNDNYVRGKIDVIKIESENNIADIFTKSLCRDKFDNFRNLLKFE